MKFSVVTLFPDVILNMAKVGVVGQAVTQNKIIVEAYTPRDWTTDLHKTVDDRPFGGGDGMVMMPQPLSQCINEIQQKSFTDNRVSTTSIRRLYLSPQGKKLDHSLVMELAQEKHILLLCGRYAGVDQRLINHYQFEEISIGDYVLSGGELGALVLIDAIGRQLEGVLGHNESCREDSFAGEGLLEAPSFTRPREWLESEVPAFLLTGHHSQIKEDRWLISVLITFKKRPDIFEKFLNLQTVDKKKWQWAVTRLKSFSEKDLTALGLNKEIIEHWLLKYGVTVQSQ